MNQTGKDEMLLRRYLLGEVSEEEREQVEERLMTDRQYFNHFLKTEEALIDEYVKGELNQDEKAPFENHFLSAPERQDKLAFSKSLNRYIAETNSRQSADASGADKQVPVSATTGVWLWQRQGRAVMAAMVLTILVLMTGIILLLVENARTKKQLLEQTNSHQAEEELRQLLDEQRKRNEELLRQLEQAKNETAQIAQELDRLRQANGHAQERPTSRLASLILAPGLVRDHGQTSQVMLSNDIQSLRLELKFDEEDYASYRVEVKTVEGKSLWRSGNLRARQGAEEKVIVAIVPASQLPEGDYLIALSAASPGRSYKEVSTYHFTVLRD